MYPANQYSIFSLFVKRLKALTNYKLNETKIVKIGNK